MTILWPQSLPFLGVSLGHWVGQCFVGLIVCYFFLCVCIFHLRMLSSNPVIKCRHRVLRITCFLFLGLCPRIFIFSVSHRTTVAQISMQNTGNHERLKSRDRRTDRHESAEQKWTQMNSQASIDWKEENSQTGCHLHPFLTIMLRLCSRVSSLVILSGHPTKQTKLVTLTLRTFANNMLTWLRCQSCLRILSDMHVTFRCSLFNVDPCLQRLWSW